MEGNLQLTPLTRLLALNTEMQELRWELMRLPAGAAGIAELQEGIDRCRRASLAAYWLSRGNDIEDADGGDGGDDGDDGGGLAGAG